MHLVVKTVVRNSTFFDRGSKPHFGSLERGSSREVVFRFSFAFYVFFSFVFHVLRLSGLLAGWQGGWLAGLAGRLAWPGWLPA